MTPHKTSVFLWIYTTGYKFSLNVQCTRSPAVAYGPREAMCHLMIWSLQKSCTNGRRIAFEKPCNLSGTTIKPGPSKLKIRTWHGYEGVESTHPRQTSLPRGPISATCRPCLGRKTSEVQIRMNNLNTAVLIRAMLAVMSCLFCLLPIFLLEFRLCGVSRACWRFCTFAATKRLLPINFLV